MTIKTSHISTSAFHILSETDIITRGTVDCWLWFLTIIYYIYVCVLSIVSKSMCECLKCCCFASLYLTIQCDYHLDSAFHFGSYCCCIYLLVSFFLLQILLFPIKKKIKLQEIKIWKWRSIYSLIFSFYEMQKAKTHFFSHFDVLLIQMVQS